MDKLVGLFDPPGGGATFSARSERVLNQLVAEHGAGVVKHGADGIDATGGYGAAARQKHDHDL